MKRNLIQNIQVMPYDDGTAVDHQGFLSAIFAGKITDAGTFGVSVTHCDTETGTFEAVSDDYIIVGANDVTVEIGDIVNLDIDLVGCKQYVKFTATGTAEADFAVALGDSDKMPV